MITSGSNGHKPRRTSYLIRRVDIAVREMLDAALREHKVTHTQYTILSIVSDTDGMSSADVARRLSVTKQTMNEMITALESKRLIGRKSDRVNRKILRIELTASGRTLLAACDKSVDRDEQAFFKRISRTRETALRRTIELLID